MTKAIPSDPYLNGLSIYEWYAIGTWGLHTDRVWKDYTGSGVKVAVVDDGFQYTHPELAANYRTDLDWDTVTNTANALGLADNNHGTPVMGIITADDNGTGSVGIAFDAQTYGIRIDYGFSTKLSDTVEAFEHALKSGADIVNSSWGYSGAFSDNNKIDLEEINYADITGAMKDLADQGRDGLGTNMIFAAGNERGEGDNANYHNLQNSIYAITVAAITEDGTYADFSNAGANILVSAGGQRIITTDKTGDEGFFSTDYVYFSGTSAATPVISGLVALMLEANPDLGWRDVQEILAYSTQFNDEQSSGWSYNGAGNWNGGGLHFNHDYGFGAADAYTAIRLAESWTLQQTSANMVELSSPEQLSNLAITGVSGTGTITATVDVQDDISIDHVLIDLDITHDRVGDLKITLVSPSGMESVLIDRPENGEFTGNDGVKGLEFTTTSVAYWGEDTAGTWSLRIEDSVSGNTGTLNSWKLSFAGDEMTNDNLYVYTDDFAKVADDGFHSQIMTDTDGGTDTINVASVSRDTSVDFTFGAALITDIYVGVGKATMIENILAGDGDDYLSGNEAANFVSGGRGNDVIHGRDGHDILEGDDGDDYIHAGTGNDMLYGGYGNDILDGGDGDDLLIGGIGADKLTGGGGRDIYGFTSMEGGADTIFGLTRGGTEADFINITDLLEGYDPLSSLISDFVQVMQSGIKGIVSVNADGIGNDFTAIAEVWGTSLTGANAQDLLSEGTLIADKSLIG